MVKLEQRAFVDGWRGRIGLVATAPGNSTEADFNRYRPEGVAVLTTRTPLGASTVEGIKKMNEYVDAAAEMLAKNAYADVILLSSTAGSFINGPEFDRAEAKRIRYLTGVKTITSSACLIKALGALSADVVTLVTPTSESLHKAEKAFMAASGITIAAEANLNFASPRDILCANPKDVYMLARRADTPESKALVLSCSGLHVMELIETLEQDLGKPVLASNQFGLWGALRALRLPDRIEGIGRLFRI